MDDLIADIAGRGGDNDHAFAPVLLATARPDWRSRWPEAGSGNENR
ncbi:hypothetical protein LJR219_005162 [Phenylobacterium sp. LjRoot219]